MKPQDLRIGNWIEIFGNPIQVLGLSKLDGRPEMIWVQTQEYVDTKIFQFKPIELTEEWLKRFNANIYEYQFRFIYKGKVFIRLNKMRDGWQCVKTGAIVKDVHSLQNLFYALTGEELKGVEK